jgi:hypothetical protein
MSFPATKADLPTSPVEALRLIANFIAGETIEHAVITGDHTTCLGPYLAEIIAKETAPDHPDLQNVRDMAKNLRDAFSKDVKQLEIRTRGLVITDALAATKAARNAQEMVLAINQVHRACGAPGNYGYGTPIGDALCALYNGNNLLCD